MFDPTASAGLATLVALEIVRGTDNFVFVVILADNSPECQRDRARLIARRENGCGAIDIRRASNMVKPDLSDAADRYLTLAGYILWRLGHLPREGQSVPAGAHELEIVSTKGRVIDKVRIRQKEVEA
jgi:CBS domain containing-hemolysin-like protein